MKTIEQNNEYVIEIENLNKSFKDKKALNNLSFKVKKGELFGFLGVNGAGKTTTLNIILDLVKKDSGLLKIYGADIDQIKDINLIKRKIGIVFQESILDDKLSVYDNLLTRAALYHRYFSDSKPEALVKSVVDDFKLQDILNQSYASLSGGQRRRVDIARALIHKPEILFLDEPTTGLDPSARKLVWETLHKIQKERKLTILLTTHYMEEANNCNYVIIIDKGNKLVQGTPSELKTKYSFGKIYWFKSKTQENSLFLEQERINYCYEDNCYTLKFTNYETAINFALKHSRILGDFELVKGTMDDVFLNVTELKRNVEVSK
ncbi:ABC transporter ATP-binding protein [Mycoplasma sp. Pen4]|uniref:ABC transporter ATP-binding protein n=1 Tax=Mycoplasma sp. Pen4 TaxID=640330 RepID=UPI001654A8D0|nr:ABC transporter ATP-binding protein [Mycoplasma sp. Pen4]QNM93928.1 ABC transporter ATP-binding protein [Mycoplasma sp. Pen4]